MDPDARTGRVSDVAPVRPEAADDVSPLLCRLEQLVASAAGADRRSASDVRAVIEGYFDAIASHSAVVGLALGDRPEACSPAARLVRDHIGRLRAELGGGAGADLDDTIRAASALAAVQSAVLELTEFDPSTVRAVVTGAAVAIVLSGPGLGTGP